MAYSHLRQTLPQPSALLDLHFCPHQDKGDICATASSTGSLSILRVNPDLSSDSKLQVLATSQVFEPDVLVLSCAWHPSKHNLVGVTASNGTVHILSLDNFNKAHHIQGNPIIEHTLEAWTLNISPIVDTSNNDDGEQFIIYSGADDSQLCHRQCKQLSFRESQNKEGDIAIETTLPIATVKGHGAGVTAILPLPLSLQDGCRIVVTGSYDDTIRVFAMSHSNLAYFGAGRTGRLLGELNIGGGVWRLKLVDAVPIEGNWKVRILASCMHAGARLVALTGGLSEEWRFETLCRFEDHQSMNYGSDVNPQTIGCGKLMFLSTSFYDKLLCRWEWPSG